MRNAGFYLGNMGGDLVEKRQISEKSSLCSTASFKETLIKKFKFYPGECLAGSRVSYSPEI